MYIYYMLEELSKKDAEWRLMAYKICGCKTLSDDLVNDMYLIVMKKERFNHYYIYLILKRLFIEEMNRRGKLSDIDDFYDLSNDTYIEERLKDRYKALELIKDLTWFEREVLLQTHEMSLRKCEESTGVSYQVYNYHKNKALEKLKLNR